MDGRGAVGVGSLLAGVGHRPGRESRAAGSLMAWWAVDLAAQRFIDYMSELDTERHKRPFQVIIVGNDIPADIARRVKVVNFKRGNGFIRDLEPGTSLTPGY
jgi:hypothetical protein